MEIVSLVVIVKISFIESYFMNKHGFEFDSKVTGSGHLGFSAPRSFSLKGAFLPDPTTRSRYRSNRSAQRP